MYIGILCYSCRVFLCIQYNDQQIYLINYNKIQNVKHYSRNVPALYFSTPEFLLQGVCVRKESQGNTPLLVSIAQTVLAKFLTF